MPSSSYVHARSAAARAVALAVAVATTTLGLTLVGFAGDASAATIDAQTIIVTAASGLLNTSETRALGHNDFLEDGLHVWTEDASSLSKAAGYLVQEEPFASLVAAGEPTIDWTLTDPNLPAVPGKQIVVDFDGNTTSDGILVGEPVYPGDVWWLSNSAAQFVKDGAPHTGGGYGSPYYGTLAEWSTAFATAQVTKVGYSMGSGVHGDGVINSMTYGETTYEFTVGLGGVVVDDDGMGTAGDCDSTATALTSIQAAVDFAVEGETVQVCAGMYIEDISVTKQLTFLGAQAGVDARTGRTDPGAESVVKGVLNANGVSGTTIDGFWFTEATSTPIALVGGSGHTVVNTVIADNTAATVEHAIVYVADGTLPTRFARNRVTGNALHGFFATGEASDVTIEDNAFAGNTESSVVHFAPSSPGESSGVVVQNNTSTGDGNFIVGSGIDDLIVEGNTVTGTGGTGMLFGGDFNNVTITNNTISGSAGSGIAITNNFGAANSAFTITENTLTGNARGISLGAGGYTGTAEVHFNRLVGNGATPVGIRNLSAGGVNSENNWWGCNEGPGSPGCDSETGFVDPNPWLVLGTLVSPDTITSTGTVTADLTRNSAGADTSAAGAVPPTPVTFATDKGELSATSGVTVDGKASTTLSRSGDLGTVTASSTVDNETVSDQAEFVAPTLAVADDSATEGDDVEFTVSLNVVSDEDVTFDYATTPGSADASDFAETVGTATITAGDTSTTVSVPTTEDTTDESSESFTLTISGGSLEITDDTATGTIVDDDAAPVVSVADDKKVIEGGKAAFKVSLSAASSSTTSVEVTTQNGTAKAPGDFVAVTRTVVFAPGETTKTVKVSTNVDGLTEVRERFRLLLSGPVGLTLGDKLGVARITANTTAPQLLQGSGA